MDRVLSDFAGLAAIVTGGASGIGAATALELQSRGANVVVLDRKIGALAGGLRGCQTDITDEDEVAGAIEWAAGQFGGIDVLVNNAGVGASGSVDEATDDEWSRVFAVNVIGAARVARHALPWLKQSASASIVNTVSVAGIVGLRNRAVYSATKGALVALTFAMAADHLAQGIRVNAVAPGTADTPWVQRLLADADDPEAMARRLRERQPINRLIHPDEVAFAIANLASPRAASTTAAVHVVDGGLVALRG